MAVPPRAFNPYLEQAQAPAEVPPPPGDQWQLPPAMFPSAPPPALSPTAPPGLTQAPAAAPLEDDDNDWRTAIADQEKAYQSNFLDATGTGLPKAGDRESHPEWGKYQEALELYRQIQNPKEQRTFEPRLRAFERRIDADVRRQESKANRARTEALRESDRKMETPKQREETNALMEGQVGSVYTELEARAKSRDPKTAKQASFDLATSPLTTLVQKKADGTPDYSRLRDVTASLALYNGLSKEAAVQYALKMGSPLGTDDDGKPAVGYNNMKGRGAATFKVLGSDPRKFYVIEMDDGRKLRVDPDTFRTLSEARDLGYRAAKKWNEEQAKAAEPGLLSRALKAVIPSKGF